MVLWTTREIELGAARRSQVTFGEGPGCGAAALELPRSKADPVALGCSRVHGCSCHSQTCPVAAARRLMDQDPGPLGARAPLWPAGDGQF
eukprot:10292742-Alexandrium_andersonii.AAC.1